MNQKFNVGDKVSRNKTACIGTVVKITEKRKDVVVDYGNFKETYNLSGWQKGADVWTGSMIYLLTPELEKSLEDSEVVGRCKKMLDAAKVSLTPDKARKIIDFMEKLDSEK